MSDQPRDLGVTRRLCDWWRGYSDQDVESVHHKLTQGPRLPGQITYLTKREAKALRCVAHDLGVTVTRD